MNIWEFVNVFIVLYSILIPDKLFPLILLHVLIFFYLSPVEVLKSNSVPVYSEMPELVGMNVCTRPAALLTSGFVKPQTP